MITFTQTDYPRIVKIELLQLKKRSMKKAMSKTMMNLKRISMKMILLLKIQQKRKLNLTRKKVLLLSLPQSPTKRNHKILMKLESK